MRSEKDVKPYIDWQVDAAKYRQVKAEGVIVGKERERFIEDFVRFGKIEEYPFPDDDIADENEFHETVCHLDERVEQECLRAFELADMGRDLALAKAVTRDLLVAFIPDELCFLRDLHVSKLSVALVLALLEALRLGLGRRVAAGVARRTTIALLNASRTKEGLC